MGVAISKDAFGHAKEWDFEGVVKFFNTRGGREKAARLTQYASMAVIGCMDDSEARGRINALRSNMSLCRKLLRFCVPLHQANNMKTMTNKWEWAESYTNSVYNLYDHLWWAEIVGADRRHSALLPRPPPPPLAVPCGVTPSDSYMRFFFSHVPFSLLVLLLLLLLLRLLLRSPSSSS
jgi:hypothetical protein